MCWDLPKQGCAIPDSELSHEYDREKDLWLKWFYLLAGSSYVFMPRIFA